MKNNKILTLTNKLNKLNNIINSYPRDSKIFMNAEDKYTSIIYSCMPPQDYGIIAKYLRRKLTNEDFAKIIIANQTKEPISKTLNLPISIVAIFVLRKCQRELHLNQFDFAKRYNVPQAKMSKMESGQQKTDIDVLQKILHDMHHKLIIE